VFPAALRVGTGPAVRLWSGRTKPDFCQFDVKNEPDGFYRTFFDFLPDFLPGFCRVSAGFLPNFCRIDVKNDTAGFRPDRTGQILKLAGLDRIQKIRPVAIWQH
jgi:hypothetical protein